jgi:hypothetical protein
LEAGEHVARLAFDLLLHLHEHLLGLFHVGTHHALHGRPLEVQELRPQVLAGRVVLAVHGAGLVLQLGLHVGEGLDVAFQVLAHHALHGIAVEADHLRQQVAGEHRHAAGLFLEDDLQQDAAGEILPALGVNHLELLVLQHQLLDVGEGDVGTGSGVVQAPVRIFLDQSGVGHAFPPPASRSDYTQKAPLPRGRPFSSCAARR